MEKKSALILTERLCLKPFSDSDREEVIELLCNDEVKKTFMVPDLKSDEEAINMFESIKKTSDSDSHFIYGIRLKDKLIGFINDTDINGGVIEVGYVIHPDMKNMGYATEALQAAIQELFRIGYTVVKAGAFEENKASTRVMEKSGMKMTEEVEEIDYRGKTHHCVYFETRNDIAE